MSRDRDHARDALFNFWHVDEVIECLPFGPCNEPLFQKVQKALLLAAPDAYKVEDGVNMDVVWHKLTPEIQNHIIDAYIKETGEKRP